MQPQTASDERVGCVTRLGVEITDENDRVSPSRLFNELKDLKHLAVTATRVSLRNTQNIQVMRMLGKALIFRKAHNVKKLGKGQRLS